MRKYTKTYNQKCSIRNGSRAQVVCPGGPHRCPMLIVMPATGTQNANVVVSVYDADLKANSTRHPSRLNKIMGSLTGKESRLSYYCDMC